MRRSCELRLADLQVETARQLSILRKKNDGLLRENDQLRDQAASATADLAAGMNRQSQERQRLERELLAARREQQETGEAAETRLGELTARLRSLEARNRELEAGGREAAYLKKAAVREAEENLQRLEEENSALRQEVRLMRQDFKGQGQKITLFDIQFFCCCIPR